MPNEHSPAAPGITADDVDYYTRRHCEQLALAIHATTGWKFVAVCDNYDPDLGKYGWIHMGVLDPDGRVLDIEGPQDPHTVLDTYAIWSESADGGVDLVIADDTSQFPLGDPPAHDQELRASRVASLLLAHHYPNLRTCTTATT